MNRDHRPMKLEGGVLYVLNEFNKVELNIPYRVSQTFAECAKPWSNVSILRSRRHQLIDTKILLTKLFLCPIDDCWRDVIKREFTVMTSCVLLVIDDLANFTSLFHDVFLMEK